MALLEEHPGVLYVAATLLPLGSFVVILLAGWLRGSLKAVRETPLGETLYQALGGDTPGRIPAYVATGAMGLAFLLSVVGFFLFLPDQSAVHEREGRIAKLSPQGKPAAESGEGAEARHKQIEE